MNMEWISESLQMASISDIKFSSLAVVLMSFIAGCDSSLIKGILNKDALLPCFVLYNDAFRWDPLVINWQRSENDHVMHSFFHQADQPWYQEKEFEGRTQLFPEEFPKGNASLLLKGLRTSDVGNYTCHVILNDEKGYTPQHVELLVQVEDMYSSEENNTWLLYVLFLVPAVLISAVIGISVYRRTKKQHIPEEEEALLGNEALNDAIESYREAVHSTRVRCCKSIIPGKEEKDDCLARRLHTNSGQTRYECIKDMSEERQEGIDNISYKKHGSTEGISEERNGGAEGMFDREGPCTIQSEDLFTAKTTKLISKRMLIAGDAGIGKSCYSKGLQKQWASKEREKELCYKCIIYITFNELNTIKEPVSVKKLLGSKCQQLSAVLTHLLNTENLLLILDGLDEFKHELKDDQPSLPNCDIDTALDISTLVSKVISTQLLPNTDVLVTSRLSSVCKISQHFTSTFILEGFTDDQIKEYCGKFTAGIGMSRSISDFIETHKLSSLVSIPLLSSTLCEISRQTNFSQFEGTLSTWSEMMFSLLQCSVRSAVAERGDPGQTCCRTGMTEESKLPENIQSTIHQLCKISYDNLILGVQEIKTKDLGVNCSHEKRLLKNISEFFFNEDSDGDRLVYRHASIRDMFAALYCAGEIPKEEVLRQCLDAWAFGDIPEKTDVPLLEKITSEHCLRFSNFIRFFIGLLPYRNGPNSSFLSKPPPLSADRKVFLQKWFKAWIERLTVKMDLMNLFHCMFELHDDELTEGLSHCIKNVNLFNVPLNALDIRAVCYCCQNSKLDTADLRLCELGDVGLEQLKAIIKNSKHVWLSSNKLTAESGKPLGGVLEDPDCAIETLALGTNRLGAAGTGHLFKALEKNISLKNLSLKDNNIADSGTEGMAQSLKCNSTLEELHLCMNFFGEDGIKNIKKLKKDRPDLKLVVRIAEEEAVLLYVEEKVQSLSQKGWKQYDKSWLTDLLSKVLKDLSDDENNKHVPDRVQKLKDNIKELLLQI